MTTPPTPAGWYPDPDGAGGQRYWNGSAWTEHRSPAVDTTPAAAGPAAHAQTPGSEQPTAFVPTWTPRTEQRGGSHRRPDDEDEQFEPTPQVTEPVSEPIAPEPPPITPDVPSAAPPEPTAPQFDTPAPDEPLFGTPPPEGPAPDAPLFGASPPEAPRYEQPRYDTPGANAGQYDTPRYGTPRYDTTQYDTPPYGAPSSAPLFDSSAPPPAAGDNRKSVVTWFLAACTALLLILIAAIVYGFFIREDNGVQVATPDLGTSTSQTPTESTATTAPTETPTESATAVPGSDEGTDGPISFTVHGVEMGPTVVSSDAPIEKTAVGQYVVVHMTVANVSADPTTFVGSFQTLTAGGTTYNIDDEATAYLGGTSADLQPGATADVSIAFDVPADVQPETIQLHADPSTPGVEFTLS
jgi:Domain of unknown function (DUF4352)/Protein of unknown function (DUF2510)